MLKNLRALWREIFGGTPRVGDYYRRADDKNKYVVVDDVVDGQVFPVEARHVNYPTLRVGMYYKVREFNRLFIPIKKEEAVAVVLMGPKEAVNMGKMEETP